LERNLRIWRLGHLRESKRLSAVLRAFEQVRKSIDAVLLVSGEFVSSDLGEPLHRCSILQGCGACRLRRKNRISGCAPSPPMLHQSRYPAAGETSGIAVRFMGIGKPVMLSDGRETTRFPLARA